MRAVATLIILSTAPQLTAQNGYVTLNESDEGMVGYLKYFHAVTDRQQGIEVWKTKKRQRPPEGSDESNLCIGHQEGHIQDFAKLQAISREFHILWRCRSGNRR
jgi:hypothetical protein